MHDLNTINKQNVENFLSHAREASRDGKFVLLTFDGLAITAADTFDEAPAAFAKLNELKQAAGPSNRFTLLLPPRGADADVTEVLVEPNTDTPPVQLLDNDPDDPVIQPRAPGLTPEEEAEMLVAVRDRDAAQLALSGAAVAFAEVQARCTALAERLRTRMQREMKAIHDEQQQGAGPSSDLPNAG